MSERMYIEWEDIVRDSETLADIIRLGSTKQFDQIIAVARGGMIPAVLLSRHLKIKHVGSIQVIGYNGDEDTKERGVTLYGIDTSYLNKESTLIVDDICDTGETFKAMKRNFLDKCTYASLYAKPKGVDQVDFTYTMFDQDEWIVFPWEVENVD